MTVTELIAQLEKLPPDAEVGIVYDSLDRMDVGLAWLARSGRVLISGYGSTVDDDDDRPLYAHREADDAWPFSWETPKRV